MRRAFRQLDYAVIAVLCLGNILDVLSGIWVGYTVGKVFGNSGEESHVVLTADSTFSYFINSILLLSLKCTVCLVMSLAADLLNAKFSLYFWSLCLWVITPIMGTISALTRSSPMGMSLSWIASVLFVTSPMRYCLMFNQRSHPVRDKTRLVVALFEFVTSTCTFMLQSCSPDSKNVSASKLATVWAAVIMPLGVTIISLTAVIKGHINVDRSKGKGIEALYNAVHQKKIVNVIETPAKLHNANLRFIVFTSLLCPAIAVTVVVEVHDTFSRTLSEEVKLEQSWFQFVEGLTSLVAIPILSLIASLSRGTRGTLWDYIVLVLVHLLNTTIMLLVYLFLVDNNVRNAVIFPPSGHSTNPMSLVPKTQHVPAKGVAVVGVFFHGNGVNKYLFQSLVDPVPKNVAYVIQSVPIADDPMQYNFSVWDGVGTRLNQSILVRGRMRYFFVVTGTATHLKEILYSPKVTNFSPARHQQCIILMSSIAYGKGEEIANKGVFTVQHNEIVKSTQLPQRNSSIQWCMPAGNTNITMEFPFSPEILIRSSPKLEPYTEYLYLVSWEPQQNTHGVAAVTAYVVTSYSVSNLVNIAITSLTVTHGLEGIVAAVTKIGYLEFFWMESPFRFRTTLFACTIVANEVAKWMVGALDEEITVTMSLAVLVLSASAGLVHVVLGALYELKFHKNK